LFGVIAFAATFHGRAGAATALAAAAALEVAAAARADVPRPALAALHVVLLAAAAAVHALFLRGLVARQRREHRRRLDGELQALRDEARDYRLIAAALGADSRAPRSREEEERKLAEGAVETLRASMFYTLGLVKRSLEARTCALLWLDDAGATLKIKELVTDSDATTEKRAVAAAGVLGAVLRDRSPVLLQQVRANQLPYYDAGGPAGAFAGVPVLDGPHLRGVLCADRPHPFDERDVAILAGAAEQALRAIRSEQVFCAVERAKYEHERFYQASAMLVRALTPEQVLDTAFAAAAQIVDFDLAVVTLHDRAEKRHRVCAVRCAPGKENLAGGAPLADLEFHDNAGLVAMVVKNRHYLPATGELRDQTTPVFTRRVKLRGVESLLVLPLLRADEAIGTFTLASDRRHHFGKDVRDMLGIIANQVAVSLENAQMYRKMETMATTDGLTGLTNHRTFQERFAALLERAARHNHRAAVILCDVDHFKRVNDTFGHPVGDEVLRRVARVLGDAVRKIDIVARYGGEEFVIVLEATDLAGAVGLAERIRQDIARLVVDTDKGPLQVTMSFGAAAFPDDARERAPLIERADHALYHAKQSGRNRVATYGELQAARRARRAV
jgi:diguanylate cyclase (GGDEF)-like protein